MEKNSTHAWTFENSSCCAAWLVLSWLIPCWGLCLPSLAVATGFQQLVLALTVTTKNNPTHFLCLPTESYPSTSSSLVALDMWVMRWWGLDPPSMLRLAFVFCCCEFIFPWTTSFTLWTVKLWECLGQSQQRGR